MRVFMSFFATILLVFGLSNHANAAKRAGAKVAYSPLVKGDFTSALQQLQALASVPDAKKTEEWCWTLFNMIYASGTNGYDGKSYQDIGFAFGRSNPPKGLITTEKPLEHMSKEERRRMPLHSLLDNEPYFRWGFRNGKLDEQKYLFAMAKFASEGLLRTITINILKTKPTAENRHAFDNITKNYFKMVKGNDLPFSAKARSREDAEHKMIVLSILAIAANKMSLDFITGTGAAADTTRTVTRKFLKDFTTAIISKVVPDLYKAHHGRNPSRDRANEVLTKFVKGFLSAVEPTYNRH